VHRDAGHQVRGQAAERHEAPIGADDRRVRGGVAAGRAVAVNTHQSDGSRHQVADEDVCGAVRVVGHQLRGTTGEDQEAAVGADGGRIGEPVARELAGGLGADQAGGGIRQGASEEVRGGVEVGDAGGDVGGVAREDHGAAVATDYRQVRVRI